MAKPTLIALTGATGSGKDTIASLLVADFSYKRMSFGDELRSLVVEHYGPLNRDERDVSYCEHGSVKDAMIKVGGKLSLSQPLLLTNMLQVQLKELATKYKSQPVVITDMRKPVEMHGLAELHDLYNVYFVEVRRPDNEHEPKALDNLLTGKALGVYVGEQILQPWLPPFNGVVVNDKLPESMLHQLQRVLELSLPYAPHQAQLLSEDEYCYG